ncbi:hypothetical protein PG984_008123 [Apiospora sp. TS-2023a]
MVPGWKNTGAGAYFLYTPSQSPDTSNDLYAVLERRKMTPEVKAQMRALQATIVHATNIMDQRVLRGAKGYCSYRSPLRWENEYEDGKVNTFPDSHALIPVLPQC